MRNIMTTQRTKESLLGKLKNSLDSQKLMQRLEEMGYKPAVPYHVISGPELAKALGVSGQTLANWRMRGVGPKPEPSEDWKANRNHYKIAEVLAYFNSSTHTDIYCDWIRDKFDWMGTDTVEDCQEAIRELIRLKIFKQPKWKRKWRPHVPEFQIG